MGLKSPASVLLFMQNVHHVSNISTKQMRGKMCISWDGNKQGFIYSGSVGIPIVLSLLLPFKHFCSWDQKFLALNLMWFGCFKANHARGPVVLLQHFHYNILHAIYNASAVPVQGVAVRSGCPFQNSF